MFPTSSGKRFHQPSGRHGRAGPLPDEPGRWIPLREGVNNPLEEEPGEAEEHKGEKDHDDGTALCTQHAQYPFVSDPRMLQGGEMLSQHSADNLAEQGQPEAQNSPGPTLVIGILAALAKALENRWSILAAELGWPQPEQPLIDADRTSNDPGGRRCCSFRHTVPSNDGCGCQPVRPGRL